MAITIRDCNSTSPIRKRYDVSFFGTTIYTTVTDNPTAVSEWITDVAYLHHLPGLIVGLDVEWRPSFTVGLRNPVVVLQLCVADLCLVYQITHSNHIPKDLVDFFSRDYNFLSFVGVGIKSDLEKLETDYGIGCGERYVDLRGLAAKTYNWKELKSVVALGRCRRASDRAAGGAGDGVSGLVRRRWICRRNRTWADGGFEGSGPGLRFLGFSVHGSTRSTCWIVPNLQIYGGTSDAV